MRIAPWLVTVSLTFAAPVSAATITPAFDSLAPGAFSGFIDEGASTGGSLAGRAGGLPHAVANLVDDTHPLAGDTLPANIPANIIARLVSSDCSALKRSTSSPGKGGACSGQSGAVAKQSVAKRSVGAGLTVASLLDLPNGKAGAGLTVASLLDPPNGKTIDLSDPPIPSTQTVAVVPVPATLTLLLTGCGLLYLVAQRRRVTS